MNRKARRAAKAVGKTEAPKPIDDAKTVYYPALTGADLNVIGGLIDAWVRSGGLAVVDQARALAEKVAAPRMAAKKT